MKRINKDRAMTGLERSRRNEDLACSIDALLEDAYKLIDWDRRNKAETSLVNWVNTYGIGLLLEDQPPKMGEVVLNQMEKAITSHTNYAIAMGRGFGKSAYTIATSIYALFKGLQKFIVIITNNARASNGILNDIYRVFQVPDSPLAQDYPEYILPFTIANGSFRRRQTFGGVSTDISKNSNQLVLPTYNDERFQKSSGSLVVTRSITGGLRGLRKFTMRPSFVLLDDIQTIETASNPEQVEKMIEIIRKDIIPLAGKERLSIIQTFTPICDGDLVAKIKEDKTWTTTTFPAMISYPKNNDLWERYLLMWDEENVSQAGHEESLQFYKDNQKEMDEGCVVFNPTRFSKNDGHISAIQKLMELKHSIGEGAWSSEYQMCPVQLQTSLPITPSVVASRKSQLHELEIPSQDVVWVCASSDLNLSKYITTTIVVFLRNHTSVVIYHKFRKCKVPINIPEDDYYQRVYNLLGQHGKELKQLGIRIDAWVIDANGQPYKAVLDFCKRSMVICGIPAAGFIGKASHMYRSYMRSRLKEDVNRTLLCGDEDERKNSGTGRKYTYFDSDYYHEKAQKGFLQEFGNIGSISFYDGNDHANWANQICSERLIYKKSRGDGTTEYVWKQIGDDHDALDSIGQALAAFASQGFATSTTGRTALNVAKMKLKPRIKIV